MAAKNPLISTVEGSDLAGEFVEVEAEKGADALDRLSRDVTFIFGLMSLRVLLVVAELHPAGWPWRMCEIALTGIRTQRRDQRSMLPQRRSVLF